MKREGEARAMGAPGGSRYATTPPIERDVSGDSKVDPIQIVHEGFNQL